MAEFSWTTQQILELAPDASSAKSGRDLAVTRKWVTLGANEGALWGECQGSGSKPYQTQIDLSALAFKCSCPSRKFPCKHGLGLFLLRASQEAAFTEQTPPQWVEEWLSTRAAKSDKAKEKSEGAAKPVDAKTQAKRVENREAKIKAGLQELSLWLHDLVRAGFTSPHIKNYDYWEKMAARLVDAQAPGLARWVRETSSLPHLSTQATDELLERLALIHLAVQGYQRLAELPPETQADLREVIGWNQSTDEVLQTIGVRDVWWVMGRRVTSEERLKVQKTWLWGEQTKRPALLLHFAHGDTPLDVSLTAGSKIEAELAFYAGSAPLRALMKENNGVVPFHNSTEKAFPFSTGISEGVAQFAMWQSRNPWLEKMPLALHRVLIKSRDDAWFAHDEQNRILPLSATDAVGWELLSLSGAQPITLFGEWDGKTFQPFSAALSPQKTLVFS